MLLSDRDILTYVMAGSLGITPFDPQMVQPSSIDVRLGRDFRVMNGSFHMFIDPAQHQPELFEKVEVADGDVFTLRPGEFALATTYERVAMPEDLAGRLEGKSSLGRLGLTIHTTAGFIDPGFEGQITLELVNLAHWPITLHPGMKIGQLCLMQMSSPARYPYGHSRNGSHYQGQSGPTASRSYQGFGRTSV